MCIGQQQMTIHLADATEAMSLAKPAKTEVQINLPSGDDQYELGYVGNAFITSRTISSSVDGMIEMSLSVQGNRCSNNRQRHSVG